MVVGAVTARGVCWSTTPNPTTANSFTSDGTGTGPYVSSLTGLTLGTTYYVRAYATNSAGTAYGNEIVFTTNLTVGTLPTITTFAITAITPTGASSGGDILSQGTAAISISGYMLEYNTRSDNCK